MEKNPRMYRCYIERDVLWFWKVKAPNGRIFCCSPKGFDTREEAVADLQEMTKALVKCYEKENQLS